MPQSLQTYMNEYAPRYRSALETFFATRRVFAKTVSPTFLHSVEVLEAATLHGGKGLRPLLVMLAYRLAGGKMEGDHGAAIAMVAAGVEVFHRHILNLDDMADRDEVRYGRPTLWKQYQDEFQKEKWSDAAHHSRTFAEIDNTLLGSYAFELVREAKLSAQTRLEIMGVMNTVMYWQTVAGWQIHYMQNHQPIAEATEEEYLKGVDLVTMEYTLWAPLQIGVIAAEHGQKSEVMEVLGKYARPVGRAFQIYDDILGMFGDTKETGKPIGNDLREGKKTLLLQRAYRRAAPADQKFLSSAIGHELSAADLTRAQNIIRDTGSLDYSTKLAEELVANGIAALKPLPDSPEKQALTDLAEYIVHRQK